MEDNSKIVPQVDEATEGGRRLKNQLNQFYFNMAINEMRLMNESVHFPNITYNSLLYLDIIAYKENCTVSFLAKAFNIAKSAVTLKINELIKQGFVEKTQSTIDKRVFYLTVKPEVIAEYKVYDTVIHSAVEAVEQRYTQAEIKQFCNMLAQIEQFIYPESAAF